jgi:VHL beta domain
MVLRRGFLAFIFASSTLLFPVVAQDGMQWSFSEFNDPDNKGRMTARLGYGVPETDNIQVSGVCDGSPSTGVKYSSVSFGADTGDLKEGEQVELHFTGGGLNHVVRGSVYGTQAEVGVSGVHADIEHDDPLWRALLTESRLDYFVPGYRKSSLQLLGGKRDIKSFIDSCRAYAKAILGDDAAADAEKPEDGSAEKLAFEAAKELGTKDAWEAFLASYPSGFRADLARAYLKKLNAKGGLVQPQPSPQAAATTSPEPTEPATKVSCSKQGEIRSKSSKEPTKITFVNSSGMYRSIMWLDFKGRPKQYANLNAGERITLDTFVSHPWMATDGPGNCIEIALPRSGSSVVTLGSGTQNERPAWQREAIKKGCKPGQAWNAQEGCHEND